VASRQRCEETMAVVLGMVWATREVIGALRGVARGAARVKQEALVRLPLLETNDQRSKAFHCAIQIYLLRFSPRSLQH
jgi:hypothetical protein